MIRIFSLKYLFIYLFSVIIICLLYNSLSPLFISILFLIFPIFISRIFNSDLGFEDFSNYIKIYSLFLFISIVPSIYYLFLKDPFQVSSDAGLFFNVTSNKDFFSYPILELQLFFENVLPLYIWAIIYRLELFLFGSNLYYTGIIVNISLISLSSVSLLNSARIVFNNKLKNKILILLVLTSGTFYMFSSIHIRDVFALFLCTLIFNSYTKKFLEKDNKKSVFFHLYNGGIFFILLNLFFSFLLFFIRKEFIIVPFVMYFTYFYLKFWKSHLSFRLFAYLFVIIFIFLFIYFDIFNSAQILLDEKLKYDEFSNDEASDSLGNKLVINQPILIRMLIGPIYMFFFPIPFWTGFLSNSFYHFAKSISVIQFYLIAPLVLINFKNFFTNRNSTLLFKFSILIILFFSFFISLTSLETRHLGAFYSILYFSLLYVDFESSKFLNLYKKKLFLIFVFVISIHISWVLLKFVF